MFFYDCFFRGFVLEGGCGSRLRLKMGEEERERERRLKGFVLIVFLTGIPCLYLGTIPRLW